MALLYVHLSYGIVLQLLSALAGDGRVLPLKSARKVKVRKPWPVLSSWVPKSRVQDPYGRTLCGLHYRAAEHSLILLTSAGAAGTWPHGKPRQLLVGA